VAALLLPPAAVLDANVLHPATLRDTLLCLTEAGLLAAYCTARILDETFTSIKRRSPDIPAERLERTRRLTEAAFEGANIEGYEHRIAQLTLPDPDDRHVLAAAIDIGADYIVTSNTAHFPAEVLAAHGVERRTPDELLLELIDLHGAAAILAVLARQAARMRRPPMTLDELLDRLGRPAAGLARTVARLRGT
jgi:predicted nucleic acid-binding protein